MPIVCVSTIGTSRRAAAEFYSHQNIYWIVGLSELRALRFGVAGRT